MPHVGRDYPYHPTFWATEAWFYRGFVPFKLRGEMGLGPLPPWDSIGVGWSGISDPGVVAADCKSIVYEIAVSPPAAFPALLVTLEKVMDGDEAKASWRCFLNTSTGIIGRAVLLQPFPQRVVFADGFDYSIPSPSFPSPIGPPLIFRPATYEEGGQAFEYKVGV